MFKSTYINILSFFRLKVRKLTISCIYKETNSLIDFFTKQEKRRNSAWLDDCLTVKITVYNFHKQKNNDHHIRTPT